MEKPSIFTNDALALSTMKQFYTEGKYYDVQLRVDNKLFKCHRFWLATVSEYFDTIFSSADFQEYNATTDEPITLHEIMDATAFEQILNFIYSAGDISVNDSNVLQLLSMNDSLRLRINLVKEECIKHLLRRSRESKPIPNAIDLFSFACKKAESSSRLVDLLSAYLCEHLHEYSENALLMEIDFEHLNTLLKFSKNYIVSLPGSQNDVLKIIHYWVDHDRAKRLKHHRELRKNIYKANICADFALKLLNRIETMMDNVMVHSKGYVKFPRTKIDVIDGDARHDATISYTFQNISRMEFETVYSSTSTVISNLYWRLGVYRSNGNLGTYLFCDGTYKTSMWKCWANATFTLVSQKEGREKVAESDRYLYASDSEYGWGFSNLLSWEDLNDPENGYILEDSFLLLAHIRADVTFWSKD